MNETKTKLTLMKLNSRDNVAVALRPITQGETVTIADTTLIALENINQGHKIALTNLKNGENVVKYGFPIGHTTSTVKKGETIHTHNLKTNLDGELTYSYHPDFHESVYSNQNLTFKGYRRKNGSVGIRNDLFIVPTVGCVNGIADLIVDTFKQKHPELKGIDSITVIKHPYGCSQLGQDHKDTRKILSDVVLHPNAGGVLVFGLGCENNKVSDFKETLHDYDPNRVKFLIAQDVVDEVASGVELLEKLYASTKEDKRENVPLSELTIGLKCGGSDGFSGITANPLLGAFSDFLIAQGGSTILTEVPEMFGAEQVLMARAENEDIFNQIVDLINNFKHYFASYGEPVYENPSPGNKDGGITTLEDKSLGCTQKAGTSKVVDVLNYGERIQKKGLNLLQAPGNDLVAASALASSGCHMVLFTTGRGTPFGSYVPTMKIATNNQIFEKKRSWMDFNAGILLDEPMDIVLNQFIEKIIAVASGEHTQNEKNNFKEIAIFKNGVTL